MATAARQPPDPAHSLRLEEGRDWVATPDHVLLKNLKTFVPLQHGTDSDAPCIRVQHHILLSLLLAPGFISPDNMDSMMQAVASAGGVADFTITDEKATIASAALAEILFSDGACPGSHPEYLERLQACANALQADARLQFSGDDVIPLHGEVAQATTARTAASSPVARRALRSARGDNRPPGGRSSSPAAEDAPEASSGNQGQVASTTSFLGLIPLNAMVEATDPLPLATLAMLRLLLGQERAMESTQVPRRDAAIELMQNHVCRAVQSASPTPQLMASAFPSLFKGLMLDPELRGGVLSEHNLHEELLDGITLSRGVDSERHQIEARRFGYMLRSRTPVLKLLLGPLLLAAPAQAWALMERLTAVLLRGRWTQSLKLAVHDVERHLSARRAMISREMEEHGSAMRIVDLLIAEHSVTDGRMDPSVARHLKPEGEFVTEITPRALQKEARTRAHNDPSFLRFWADHRGVNFLEDPVKVWAAVLLSGSAVLIRFFMTLDRDSTHDGTHEIYGRLRLIEASRRETIALAQVTGDDGTISLPELRSWRWSKAAFNKLLGRRYHEIDWVNADTGVIGIHNLKTVNGISPVASNELWTVISVIKLMLPFIHRTFTAIGYDHESSVGFTIATLLERHVENLEWCSDLGGSLADENRKFMAGKLVEELEVIGDRARAMDGAASPADIRWSTVAPFNCSYVRETELRRTTISPLHTLRRAIREVLPAGTPRVLEGVKAASAGRSASNDRSSKAGAAKGPTARSSNLGKRASPSGGGASSPPSSVDTPGSKSYLAVKLSDTELMLGGRDVFFLDKIAAHFNLDLQAKCWPLLLTRKPDSAKLALCPCHRDPAHRTLTSPAHVPPAGWSLEDVTKKFSRAATSAERSKASVPASTSSSGNSSRAAGGSASRSDARKRRRP